MPVISILLSALWPGVGHMSVGDRRPALAYLTLPWLVVIAFAANRSISSVHGLYALAFILAGIYFTALAHLCVSLLIKGRPAKQRKTGPLLSLLGMYGLVSIVFFFKSMVLGAEIYFIPTQSMQPTLVSGDFILVDTWLYKKNEPGIGDIVTFTNGAQNLTLVKRISSWPTGEIVKNGRYYLRGDNPPASRDSRYFGGVPKDNILGKVTGIVCSIDTAGKLHPDRSFTSVH